MNVMWFRDSKNTAMDSTGTYKVFSETTFVQSLKYVLPYDISISME